MVRSRVDITMNFGRITDAANDLAKEAVYAGAQVGGATAHRVAATRSGKTKKLESIEVLPVRGTPDGWEASFRSQAYYRLFQDLGTLRRRTRKLSAATEARRSSPSGQERLAKVGDRPGIEPLYMYRQARAAGRKAMMAVIQRGI